MVEQYNVQKECVQMTQSHPVTLRELSLQYLSAMAGRKSEGSLRQWRSVLERHVWPLLGERTTLTDDDINAFIEQKRAEGFTARTVVNQSSLLRQLARYGQRTGVLSSVDLSRVQVQHLTPPKATEESPSDVLSREEQSRLVAQFCREQLLLAYFGETGAVACGHCDVCRELAHRIMAE